jgi:hypothetical protein
LLLFAAFFLVCAKSPTVRSGWTSLLAIVALLGVDRLLTARAGFAVLSLLSVAVWAAVAALLSSDLAVLLPAYLV